MQPEGAVALLLVACVAAGAVAVAIFFVLYGPVPARKRRVALLPMPPPAPNRIGLRHQPVDPPPELDDSAPLPTLHPVAVATLPPLRRSARGTDAPVRPVQEDTSEIEAFEVEELTTVDDIEHALRADVTWPPRPVANN